MNLLANCDEIKNISCIANSLTNKSIKLLMICNERDSGLIENSLRFLKTLSLRDLLSIEECHYSGILKKFDKFLINPICYEYISGKFVKFLF